MSAIAILDYGGAEDQYNEMEKLAEEGRQEWEAYRSEVLTEPTMACVRGPLPSYCRHVD